MKSNTTNKSRVGDIVELKAQAWLLSEGYEVFANVSSKGPADLVAIKDNKVLKVDVKKVVDGHRKVKRVAHPRKTELQKEWDVVFLYYDEDKDIFAWDVSYIRKNRGLTEEPKQTRPPITNFVDGKEFKSIAAMARHYNISPRTLRSRISKGQTAKEAVEAIHKTQKKLFVNGREFADREQLTTHYGIPIGNLDYWMYEKGYTAEDAINILLQKKEITS